MNLIYLSVGFVFLLFCFVLRSLGVEASDLKTDSLSHGFSPKTLCAVSCYQECYHNWSFQQLWSCTKSDFQALVDKLFSIALTFHSKMTKSQKWDVLAKVKKCLTETPVNVPMLTIPFKGSTVESTQKFTVPDICQRYDFRVSMLIAANDTIISLPPTAIKSSPPDFIIENIHLSDLSFHKETNMVRAEYTWKRPWGYHSEDVESYFAYVHPTICSVPEGLGIIAHPEKTEEGGRLVIRFPEIMAKAKCRFLIHVEAKSICGQRNLKAAQAFLQLNCLQITNYPCGSRKALGAPYTAESLFSLGRPYCLSERKDPISLTALGTVSKNHRMNATLSWSEPPYQAPLYYHVRYGEVKKESFLLPGLQPPNPGGQHFPSPQFDPFRGIFQMDKSAKDLKVPGNKTSVNLTELTLNSVFGLQICAIYDHEYKLPNFQMLEVLPYKCICEKVASNGSCATVMCGRNKEMSIVHGLKPNLPVVVVVGSEATTIPLPAQTVDQRLVENFSESLVQNASRSSVIRISWREPEGSFKVERYRLFLESQSPCSGLTVACCSFAQLNPIAHSSAQASEATLTLPHAFRDIHCKFTIKVEATFDDGFISTTSYNLSLSNNLHSAFVVTATTEAFDTNDLFTMLEGIIETTTVSSPVSSSSSNNEISNDRKTVGIQMTETTGLTEMFTSLKNLIPAVTPQSSSIGSHSKHIFSCLKKKDINFNPSTNELTWSSATTVRQTGSFSGWILSWGLSKVIQLSGSVHSKPYNNDLKNITLDFAETSYTLPQFDRTKTYGVFICVYTKGNTTGTDTNSLRIPESAEFIPLVAQESDTLKIDRVAEKRPISSSGSTGLPSDVALALKIVIPISLLIILLGLLSIFIFYYWQQIKDFWLERQRSCSYRPGDYHGDSHDSSPVAIGLQETVKLSNGHSTGSSQRKVSCTTFQKEKTLKGISSDPNQQRTFVKKLDL